MTAEESKDSANGDKLAANTHGNATDMYKKARLIMRNSVS
jgi:hypothetical protein